MNYAYRVVAIYHTYFKCERWRLRDYLNLSGFLRDIYQLPRHCQNVGFNLYCHHYSRSHITLNPPGIISIERSSISANPTATRSDLAAW